MIKHITSQLSELKLVPVVVIENPDHAVPLARTLMENGCDAIEITFRTEAALAAVARIAREVPGMLVGAGTLLTVKQMKQAQEAGATFGVAPGFDPALITAAHECGFAFIPGVATASEMGRAVAMNCALVKFFPAEAAGGIQMVKALLGAFRHTGVRIMPTGGINASNIADWLAVPEVVACGGSWICEASLIASENWEEIGKRTREALAAVR